jgi:hypothetical protein
MSCAGDKSLNHYDTSSLLFSFLSFFFCYPTQLLLNIMWYSTSFTSTTWKMIRQKMLQIIAIDSLFAEVKLCSSYVLLSQSFSRNKNVFKYFWVHWKYFFSVKQMNENRHQRLGMDKTRCDISKLPRLSWDSHLENLTFCFPPKIDSSLIPAFNTLRSEKKKRFSVSKFEMINCFFLVFKPDCFSQWHLLCARINDFFASISITFFPTQNEHLKNKTILWNIEELAQK